MGVLPPDSRHADPVIQRLLDWLKTNVAADRGVAQSTFAGATNLSGIVTVPHGLGRKPSQVITQVHVPIANTTTRGFTVEVDPATFTDKSFQARVWCSAVQPPAGTTIDFAWEAH